MATPEDQIPDEKPYGGVESFEASARAILEEAPNLDRGLTDLAQYYQSFDWDKKDQAKKVAETYGDLLRHRFKDESTFSNSDLAVTAPVSYQDAKPADDSSITDVGRQYLSGRLPGADLMFGSPLSPEQEAQLKKINGWEQQNLAAFDSMNEDHSLMVVNRSKFEQSIKETASKMRNQVFTTGQNTLGDVGYRFLEGALGAGGDAVSNLTGWERPKKYIDYLREHNKDAEGSDLSAFVANSIKGLSGGLGNIASFEAGGLPAFAAQGLATTYNRYHDSFQKTGDKSQAYLSGGVEAVNQAFQVYLGAKLLGAESTSLQNSLLEGSMFEGTAIDAFLKTPEAAKQIAKNAAAFGGLNVAGTIGGNVAENAGEGDSLTKDIGRNTATSLRDGLLLGTLIGATKLRSGQSISGEDGGDASGIQGTRFVDLIDSLRGKTEVQDTTQKQLPAPQDRLGLPEPAGDFTRQDVQGSDNSNLTSHEFRPQEQKALPNVGYTGEENVGPVGKGANKLSDDGRFYINKDGTRTKVPFNPQGFKNLGEQSTNPFETQSKTASRSIDATRNGKKFRYFIDSHGDFLYKEELPQIGELVGEQVDHEATANPETIDGRQAAFTTVSGDAYIQDGNNFRRVAPTGTVYHPLDKTFFVDKNTGIEAALDRFVPDETDGKNYLSKDGDKLVKITTDAKGRVIGKEEIPTVDPQPGAIPVSVNEAKNHNGSTLVYQSHIGTPIKEVNEAAFNRDESIGAAKPREMKVGERVRFSDNVNEETKSYFGDKDSGTLRYFPETNVKMLNAAGKEVGNMSVDAAYEHFLNTDPDRASTLDIGTGIQVRRMLDEAGNNAERAGDKEGAASLALQEARVFEHLGKMGVTVGRGVGLFKVLADDLGPQTKAKAIRGKIYENSYNELSRDLNLTPDEIKNIPSQVDEAKKALDQSKKEDKENTKEGETPEPSEKTKLLDEEYKKVKKIADKVQTKLLKDQAKFTPEDEASLIKFHTLLKDATDPKTQKQLEKATKKIEDKLQTPSEIAEKKIHDKAFGEVKKLWSNLHSFVAANLVGLGSIIKKSSFDVINALVTPTIYLGTGQKAEAYAFTKELLNSFYDWRQKNPLEAVKASKFTTAFLNTLFTGETSKFKGKDFLAEGPAGLRYVGIIPRTLSAITEAFSLSNRDAQVKAEIARLLKKSTTPEALRQSLAESISKETQHYENHLADIRATNELLKQSTGEGMSEREMRLAAWDRAFNTLPENLRERSDFFGQKQVLINKPTGTLGQVYEAISKFKIMSVEVGNQSFQPFKYPLTFIRVGLNLINASAELSPLGFYKAAHATEFAEYQQGKKIFREKGELERIQQLGRATVGTAMLGYFLFKAWDNKDKDYPEFMVHGEGPPDYQEKQQYLAKGWTPESIQVGDKFYSFKDSILSVPLGMLGGFMDLVRYQKDVDPEDITQMAGLMGLAAVQSVTSNSMFKTLGDAFDAIANLKTNPSYAANKLIDITLTNPAKGLIPFYGSLRFLGNNVQDTTKGLFARITSGLPYAESLGDNRPALNYFGDPIQKPYGEKFGFLPGIGYHSSDASQVDPEWQWLAQNNYSLPHDQGHTIKLFTEGNPKDASIEAKRLKEYEDIGAKFGNVLTPDERYELIEKAGPKVKAVVNQFMNRYGYSGHNDQVQNELKKAVSKVFNETKKEMFLR